MTANLGTRTSHLAAGLRAYSNASLSAQATGWSSVDVLLPGIMALAAVALGLVLAPRVSWPIADEAFYAGPAFRLAQTGLLLLEPEVQPSLVMLVAWGALFAGHDARASRADPPPC